MNKAIAKTKFKQTEIGMIPEDCEAINLDKMCKIISSKRIFEDDYVQNVVPLYRGTEISLLIQNRTIKDKYCISKEKYNSLAMKYGYPKKGDILLTAVGTLGNVYLINDDRKFYFKDGNLIWLKDITEDQLFITYSLRNQKTQIIGNAIGSSQKALTITSD